MLKDPLYIGIGFKPVIEDNHILYYKKGNYHIYEEKYKMVEGIIEMYMQITKKDKVIYEGVHLSEEQIEELIKSK